MSLFKGGRHSIGLLEHEAVVVIGDHRLVIFTAN